jgi:hypothetical protein
MRLPQIHVTLILNQTVNIKFTLEILKNSNKQVNNSNQCMCHHKHPILSLRDEEESTISAEWDRPNKPTHVTERHKLNQ